MTAVQSLDLATSLMLATAHGAHPVRGLDPVPAPSEVTPGWLGFGVFVALFVVTILLWFNMRKQLGKIDFDDGSERRRPSADNPDGAGATADTSTEPPAPDRP